ncbi:MAG: hypothetical protein V3T27_04405 [Alphaproteobacteria bacterium]
MDNLIAGLIPAAMVIVFLGSYAVRLDAIPLWIIIIAILAMVLIDLVQSVMKGKNGPRD